LEWITRLGRRWEEDGVAAGKEPEQSPPWEKYGAGKIGDGGDANHCSVGGRRYKEIRSRGEMRTWWDPGYIAFWDTRRVHDPEVVIHAASVCIEVFSFF
jgi:hypothetical protein